MVIPGARELYLRRPMPSDAWRIVASVQRDSRGSQWRAEYRNFENGLARDIHLVSADRRHFDLDLALAQLELNAPLDDEAFRVRVAPGTEAISLNELTDGGPLAAPAKSDGS